MVLAKSKEPKLPTPPSEPAGVECLQCCSLGAMGLVGQSGAPSSDGERDSGMVDAKIVSELPRELPPEEEVDCVSNSVAGSPREVVLPKQERPRQRCSRRSRNRGKAERKAESPSHEDRDGTEAQQKAEGNGSHGHERGPRRQGKFRGKFDWVGQLANLVANRLKLLEGKQADQQREIGQSGNATGSWGKRRGSLPRWRQREEPVRSRQLEATGTLAWDSCLLGVLKLPCGGKVTSAIDEGDLYKGVAVRFLSFLVLLICGRGFWVTSGVTAVRHFVLVGLVAGCGHGAYVLCLCRVRADMQRHRAWGELLMGKACRELGCYITRGRGWTSGLLRSCIAQVVGMSWPGASASVEALQVLGEGVALRCRA
ncbi:hypothetical protein GH714_043975 [Hevea brasiliensis]|uniref:Uncharacterized protein n=1 Tax=Hevea brasiliensis TaxID=3981 RepID=A0A6A6K2W1_HEVBR|nr:hypothetical protein GH714_043975 [Hevea brasiliensis]